MKPFEIKLKTLTPLWTGGADGTMDRIHETGIIGSLRWWYEALVRGLGGYACDPTSEDRCSDKSEDRSPDKDEQHCVACELFGCTGWARKFRLIVTYNEGTITNNFIPLRLIAEEEWCLLDLTVRWIAEYGALGGKTVFKPSDEHHRQNQSHHKDFGIIQYLSSNHSCVKSLDALKTYVTKPIWRPGSHIYTDAKGGEHDHSWASLQNFWCVKGRHLTRKTNKTSTFNMVVGRKQDKSEKERRGRQIIRWSDLLEDPTDRASLWLAGSQQESKKVFSFKLPDSRTFGFVKPGTVDFAEMKKHLKQAWPDFDPDKEFMTGEQILKALCSSEGVSR